MVEHHPLAGSQAFAGLQGAASCLHVVPDYLLAMDRSLAPCWRLFSFGGLCAACADPTITKLLVSTELQKCHFRARYHELGFEKARAPRHCSFELATQIKIPNAMRVR